MNRLVTAVALLVVLFGCNLLMAESFPSAKGNWLVGGGASLIMSSGDLYENLDGDGATSIVFAPNFGYFVSNGFSIGGLLDIENQSQGDYSVTAIGVGPDLRYYFNSNRAVEGRGLVLPYIRGAFQYLNLSGDMGDGSGTTFHFGGGFAYMLTNSAALTGEGFFELDSAKPEDGESTSGNQFGVMFGFTLFITR